MTLKYCALVGKEHLEKKIIPSWMGHTLIQNLQFRDKENSLSGVLDAWCHFGNCYCAHPGQLFISDKLSCFPRCQLKSVEIIWNQCAQGQQSVGFWLHLYQGSSCCSNSEVWFTSASVYQPVTQSLSGHL